ncbi:cytochrome P450 Tp9025 [Lactuca sativa]|uniref:Cytochrome P450 n=1 Tax=Lactuca sativa TaxID=4236 RepID=A0A9R1VS96_LACSA|nr:cytochrome P450 Tp9025 [Lactuca sativa]KAJ0209768.1 hypothetical protein LSAT_V11C400217320 [Lactuca sativa]
MAIDMTIILMISSFILSIYYIFNRKPKSSKPLNLPPGPPKLPIIGNLYQIGLALPHRAFLDLSKKYGPIMSLQLGQISMVVVSSPRLAEEVLKNHDLALASRPYALLADILLYGGIDIAFGRYSDYWRQMKKIVTMELLSVKKVQSFMGFRATEIDRFTEVVQSCVGKPVHIRKRVMKMNNTVVCKCLFGNDCRQQDVLIELAEQVVALSSGYYVADLFPTLTFLSTISGMKSRLTKIHKSLDNIFDEIFEERRIRRQTVGPTEDDLIDVLFNIKERGGLRFPVTDNNIKAIFLNMLIGGTDTSVVTIEWAMTELMRNPDVMMKAQAEVREAFKGEKTIAETELHKLVYLKHIIKETLRLHITIPLLLPRECRQQVKIGGYDIPVKMKVVVNGLACGTDPEYWDDAQTFKPERFENTSYDFFGTSFEYIPFGSGRRICPGIAFGLVSIELTLARLLYHFNWQLPNGLSPKDIDMTESHGVTAIKKDSLEVIPTVFIPF